MTLEMSPENSIKKIPKWQPTFLTALSSVGKITDACKIAGVSRMTAWRHKTSDPDFAKQWADAEQQAADVLEAEAWRRAHDGVEEPVYYKGEICGTVRKYSDLLLIFLLKGIRPEKYRERFILPPGELDRAIERELALARGEAAKEEPSTDSVN